MKNPHVTMPNSDGLIDDLVRKLFNIEPATMAALAHGDEQVCARFVPDAEPTTEPLDGLDVLVRRTVALTAALCDHPGPAMLVTERQAKGAGWPSALLANKCVVLAWALFVATVPVEATPLLLEADEEAGDAMATLIRCEEALPDLHDLLAEVNRQRDRSFDNPDPAPVTLGDAPAPAHGGVVSIERLLADWFGMDAGAIDLPVDWIGTRVEGANARAVTGIKWLINMALHLGTLIEKEAVPAVRLKTEADARLAGEPNAAMANCALLLGVAIRHARHLTVRVLPSRNDLAAAVVEAGLHARARRLREGENQEALAFDALELQDLAARGYVHVGQAAAREVAWRQIRGGA